MGAPSSDPVLEWAIWRSGDEGLLSLGTDVAERPRPRLGALLRSDSFRSGSWTDTRVGDEGKASSTAFRGARIRFGDPEGLCVRSCGEYMR